MSSHYITLHYITLHYITLQSTKYVSVGRREAERGLHVVAEDHEGGAEGTEAGDGHAWLAAERAEHVLARTLCTFILILSYTRLSYAILDYPILLLFHTMAYEASEKASKQTHTQPHCVSS